jgi:hypothetical protein
MNPLPIHPRIVLIALLAALSGISAGAQHQIPANPPPSPPPTPAQAVRPEKTQLQEIMGLIQQELGVRIEGSWTIYVHDSLERPVHDLFKPRERDTSMNDTVEYSNIAADAGSCSITFHLRTTRNGNLTNDSPFIVDLHNVQFVTVSTTKKETNDYLFLAGGASSRFTAEVTPDFFVLHVKGSPGSQDYSAFAFSSEETANRVANLMNQAIQLCNKSK